MKYQNLIVCAKVYQNYFDEFKKHGGFETAKLRKGWTEICEKCGVERGESIVMAEVLKNHEADIHDEIVSIYAKYLNNHSELCYDNNEFENSNVAFSLAESIT